MYPQDLRYTPEHEWVRREGPTVLRFGITSHAAEALGDVRLSFTDDTLRLETALPGAYRQALESELAAALR